MNGGILAANGYSKADRIPDGDFSVLICSHQLERQPCYLLVVNIHLQATNDQLVKWILISSLMSCLGRVLLYITIEKKYPFYIKTEKSISPTKYIEHDIKEKHIFLILLWKAKSILMKIEV
nr:MAG TPA: hypothetical protein [Caudoviricetes sp.]